MKLLSIVLFRCFQPENILCMDTATPGYDEIKLIDFGLARELKSGASLSVICGTPEFVGTLSNINLTGMKIIV